MHKVCTKCSKEKDVSLFSKNGRRKDGYHSWCKECHQRYISRWHRENKSWTSPSAIAALERRKEWYYGLKDGACIDCGKKFHFSCMQWDHLPEYKKLGQVSLNWSKKRILEEIDKCELVCANCHAYRTWQRLQTKENRAKVEIE